MIKMLNSIKEFKKLVKTNKKNLDNVKNDLHNIAEKQAAELNESNDTQKAFNNKANKVFSKKKSWQNTANTIEMLHSLEKLYSKEWHNYNHKITKRQVLKLVNRYNNSQSKYLMSLYLPKDSNTGIIHVHALKGNINRITKSGKLLKKYSPKTAQKLEKDFNVKNIKLRVNFKYSNISSNKVDLKLVNIIKRDLFHNTVSNNDWNINHKNVIKDTWNMSDYIKTAYQNFKYNNDNTLSKQNMNIRAYPMKNSLGIYINKHRMNMSLRVFHSFWNSLANVAIKHMSKLINQNKVAA